MISLTNAEVTSPEFQVTTSPTEAPSSLDAALEVAKISQTSALVSWRTLTPSELTHIDGAQVKYKDVSKQVSARLMLPYESYPCTH